MDLENCKIKIRNTLKLVKVFDDKEKNIYHRELKLIRPKTKTSIRDIDFPRNLVPILKSYFIEQEEKWLKNGLQFNDDSLIFTTDTCQPLDPSNFYKAWKRLLIKYNIELKKFHSLRDTYATFLFRKGATLTDVRDLLGHTSILTTEKYYIYVFPESKKKAAELANELIA